jgi:hypothetical protein
MNSIQVSLTYRNHIQRQPGHIVRVRPEIAIELKHQKPIIFREAKAVFDGYTIARAAKAESLLFCVGLRWDESILRRHLILSV